MQHSKPLTTMALALAIGSLTSIGPALAQGAFDPAAAATVPSTDITYEAVNEAIQMGAAWGDRANGAHGTFGTFIANFQTPFHVHTHAYHGVVVEGTMTNPFKDDPSVPEMGPGSYWYVPAGAIHATACVSDTPCRFFFTAEGAFDFDVHEE